MKELKSTLREWINKEGRFTITRVIKTWGSSPRPVGSTMLVDEEMIMAGSVSGGCVEGSVVKSSIDTLKTEKATQLNYGVTDEDAWQVGLSCGGKIEVFQQLYSNDREENSKIWQMALKLMEENEDFILVTPIKNGIVNDTLITPTGNVIGPTPEPGIIEAAIEAYRKRRHIIYELNEQRYFIHLFPRKSQMLIIGSAHITTDLVRLGKEFGFETIVIDPRGIFAHKTNYTVKPDQIIEEYPSEVLSNYKLDANTYAVILSHDPKIDDNALKILIPSDVAYIGALGSKKTHLKRCARLVEGGFTTEQIDQIKAPIGLNISAKTPKEIALSIMAEIIGEKNSVKT